LGHYSSFRSVDVAALRASYAKALATPPDEAKKDSPLRPDAPPFHFPRIVSRDSIFGPARGENATDVPTRAKRLVESLTPEGYWLTPLRSTSHPYKGDGPKEIASGDFGSTNVGDAYDTSPFPNPERVMGISTSAYIANMATLLRWLER
jgi:hypothetical protein